MPHNIRGQRVKKNKEAKLIGKYNMPKPKKPKKKK